MDDDGLWDEQDAPVFSGLSPRSVHRVGAALIDARTMTTTTASANTTTLVAPTATAAAAAMPRSAGLSSASAVTAAGASPATPAATTTAVETDIDVDMDDDELDEQQPPPPPPRPQQVLRARASMPSSASSSQQRRVERSRSSGDGSTTSPGGGRSPSANRTSPSHRTAAMDLDWGVDEDGWMPNPARLHSGKTRSCAACFAPLQYTTAQNWDEYLESDAYLAQLQENLLDDAFISGLICGDSTNGDLPTEHRMHKNRKTKCRQSVHDYLNMVSAGVVDSAGHDKGSVRILEEMLLTVLPTPLFTHVVERRLAVISHSSRIASQLLTQRHVQRVPRPVDASGTNVELHHLAMHTLSALLASFDYSSTRAQLAFDDLAQLLACFPVLSLYTFWSPKKKSPEKPLALERALVSATSCAASPKAHAADLALDDSDATFWLSQQRPGLTHFVLRDADIGRVTTIHIRWHGKSVPQKVAIEYRVAGTDTFVQVAEAKTTAVQPPETFAVRFPLSTTEMRIAMSGIPPINRNGTYAIEYVRLNVPCANSLFVEPRAALDDVARWLLGTIRHSTESVVIEAISALKAWALATASLSTTLLFVQMLLDFGANCTLATDPSVAQFALAQGVQLLDGVRAYKTDESDKMLRGEGKKKSSESRKVRAMFEPAMCSSGVTVEDAGLTVRTRETSYQYAAVNAGISTGKASWKFRLDNDTVDDEMTCFGAAILPVTVSGYDSSPSLWMLRGYNGNLYARGHKLSRSIGKVHPGDVVQIEVDMTEGTLAYKINETEYGVVFTDLAGHEVYPAVSFYGSGKVITLLGVQKWDDADAGAADIDPVYLSSLKEYHHSVGYGTLGKGNQLGYASDADARTLPTSTTTGSTPATTASHPVTINGEPRQRCLSTHPPSRGAAFVIYDLGEAFHRLVGAVGINDDVQKEMLQQRGVSVTFSIVGDGLELWHSKNACEVNHAEKFDLSVRGVRMLELVVACAGSNHCAHAIWIDPCVYPLDDWTCTVCTFTNKSGHNVCSICRSGTRDANLSSTLPAAAAAAATPLPDALTAARLASTDDDHNAMTLDRITQHANPFLELSAAITSEVFALGALTSTRESRSANDCNANQRRTTNSNGGGSTTVGFEEPFCRQPCGTVFALLLDLLRRFQTDLVQDSIAPSDSMSDSLDRDDNAHAELAQRMCISTLGIVSANFESLNVYDAGDVATEIGLTRPLTVKLRRELEHIANINDATNNEQRAILARDVQIAASETIIAGISVIYSSPREKLHLLLHLLRSHATHAFDTATSRYVLLSALLQLLASPGQDGVLNLFPFLQTSPTNDDDASVGADSTSRSPLVADVNEAIRLIIAVIQQADWRCATNDDASNSIARDAMALLKTYQLFLLAEAVGLTKTMRADASESAQHRSQQNVGALTASELDARRLLVQESTLQYGFQLLCACRELVETLVRTQTDASFVLSPTECTLQANLRTFETPMLSELLPWFVSCLCLLRRQTWLARPILPALCRLLGSVDQYCAGLEVVDRSDSRLQKLELHEKARQIEAQELERMLAVDKALVGRQQTSKQMYNVFKQLYTGDKDHFEGQIGFQFEATSTFAVVALGRSVNPTKNSGRLVRQHTVRLWEEASQQLVAQVVVTGTSRKDALGYALESLGAPIKLTQGKLYRLTTQEYANGGDPWYKKENLPDEEYDSSYIKILRDCYASGSTAFPNSQNLSGAAYGVPTFLVEGETPIASIPRFAAPFGILSVKFNVKRKLESVSVSHSGTAARSASGGASWRSCYLQTAFVQGVHSIDFVVKSARVGGAVSGHVCVGVDWSLCLNTPAVCTSPSAARYESFFGETLSSIGWMPAIGALWVKGQRASYGRSIALVSGDILTLVIDYDLHTLAFAHNGKRVGIAVGLRELRAASSVVTQLPVALTPGVSLFGAQDVVQIRPSGIAKSTLRVHWLFDLHNSLASLAGRIASTLIAGHPVDGIEEELLPWLQSPLLSGGILSDSSSAASGTLEWQRALEAEYAKHPSDAAFRGLLLREPSGKDSGTAGMPLKCSSGATATLSDDLYMIRQSAFFASLSSDMSESGPVQIILHWLDKRAPDRSFLNRLGRFPQCEQLMCAALIKHAPPHVLHEAQAIVSGAANSAMARTDATADAADHSNLDPSEDLLLVWKRIMTLRHWLIKTRQEYRARAQDHAPIDQTTVSVQPPAAATNSVRRTSNTINALPEELDFEKRLSIPTSFEDFIAQVCQRAEFLCLLDPPSEERDKLGVDSQVALSNLAEKWSAQKTPPALQPMLERWKSLGEADSSKWSGIVDVLRAQDRWRTRRASVTDAAVASQSTEQMSAAASSNLDALDENDDTCPPTRQSRYKDSFSATLKACDLYIRNGVGAPPAVLRSLLERRQKRSDSRLFGLEAMHSVLSILSFDSARHNAVIFLRPALRGFTDDERESRELNDGHVVTETFRATVRHHYLKGLEGCNRPTLERVQQAFCGLYAFLAQLLTTNGASSAQLQHAILCAWSLDFEPRDHPFLLKSGILSTVHGLFSIQSSQLDAAADLAALRTTAKACADRLGTVAMTPTVSASRRKALQYTSINWYPLSEDFVQQSVLHTGYVTKRDILRLLLRAPPYACSQQWWRDSGLDVLCGQDDAGSAVATGVRHTASSMSLLYSELLANLQSKLSWCCPHLLGRKVLQLGMNQPPSTATGQTAKAAGVSFVETPALGDVQDFSLEMWVYPVELTGYRSLRSDNGFQDGSVYVEFVDEHIQLAICGNYPREQLFASFRFRAHEWAHVALTYSSAAKRLVLAVNGIKVDERRYERVCRSIHFRTGRLGCWVSDVDAHGGAGAAVATQRNFKGAIAEVRVWRVARTVAQIARDFQRSTPFEVVNVDASDDATTAATTNALLALWHLDEGEGLCGFDSAPMLSQLPAPSTTSARESIGGKSVHTSACHWALMNAPVVSSPAIDAIDATTWTTVLHGIVAFQRRLRLLFRERYQSAALLSRLVCQYNENRVSQRWSALAGDSDDDVDSDNELTQTGAGTATSRGIDASNNPLLALDRESQKLVHEWSASTDQQILLRKQTKRCAWIVFRFLATIGVGGVHERREGEAKTVAALAKLKRKQKLQKGELMTDVHSPMPQQRLHGKTDAARAARLSYDEEDQHARSIEAASDAAKSAAGNRELAEPVLQTLWFSQEFHRKVFEVIEKELVLGTALIQDAEGLTRAQRMLRSISTPMQRRSSALRSHASGIDVAQKNYNNSDSNSNTHVRTRPRQSSEQATQSGELLETLEVEMSMFALLSFMLSLSGSVPALQRLAKSKTLRELLELLRTASPRSQRVVKLLLRHVCCSGIVTPAHVSSLLGSESIFVDLLLDQVAESVCSTAAPLSTHSVGTPTTAAGASVVVSGDSTTSTLISESLANPIGFRSGQIYLVLASESVALLRLLLKDKRWQSRVAELLCSAIRNVAPILTRRKSDARTSSTLSSDSAQPSDIRVRAAIVRAVGALCVLGSHSDCLRIGGRVEVSAKDSRPSETRHLDYGFNFSGNSCAGPAPATLIELNPRTSTVRVVFDSSSEEVDPGHNVQEVGLSSLSPIEEIRLPSDVIPLTMDMMPVILKLASLEESSVMASFDDLWRMQVRSRALLALEAILRHSVHMAQDASHRHITTSLLRTALSPVCLHSFVSLPFLQERGRMILCRLIESSTPLGSAMFRGLGDPQPPALAVGSNAGDNDSSTCPADIAISDPEEEEAETYRLRRGFASNIAAMGFAFDLCMVALEHCRDDPNLAVDWLMGPAAAAYQEQQQAQRRAAERLAVRQQANATGRDGAVAAATTTALSLEAKAQELESISGMPYRLALCALELSSSDPNRAMEWLMEHGTRYVESTSCLTLLADDFVTEHALALNDHAAMEDVDQFDPLVTASSARATTSTATTGAESTTSTSSTLPTSSSMVVNDVRDHSDIMAVTLAPILAPAVDQPGSGSAAKKPATSATTAMRSKDARRNASALGFAPLDPNYLTPHVLLSVSSEIGPLQSLSISGRTGVYRRSTPEQGVLITFLNTETGAYEDEWHLPQDVRRITKIYDEPVENVSSIHRVALRTENALATHYARRAIAALLDAGNTGCNHDANTADASASTLLQPSVATSSFADATMSAVGGPRQFVNLLKLVAASEMVFSSSHDPSRAEFSAEMTTIAGTVAKKPRRRHGDAINLDSSHALSTAGSRTHVDDSGGSILDIVQQITLDVLDEEARSGKVQNADWLWQAGGADESPLSSRSSSSSDIAVDSSSEQVAAIPTMPVQHDVAMLATLIQTDAVESVMLDEFGELDEDLYRALAMSVQDAQSQPTITSTQTRHTTTAADAATAATVMTASDEETKGDDDTLDAAVSLLPRAASIRVMRKRQPSYAEAQQVASEYLGGSVDDHDGLLSSVLVKECVSHFVESTRVASEGLSIERTTRDPRLALQEFQSLHPYFGRCDYTQAVAVDAAFRSVRVVFDHRCALGAKSKLSFFADAECTQRLLAVDAAATSGGKRIPDLLVHASQLWFRFVAAEDDVSTTTTGIKSHGYGYRFQVKPMPSICWSKEDDVLVNPSLEWACWLLELLLNDATELVARGAVHNRKIYGALVRYLRSPGAPFKSRVVRLLLQLLHRPELFPRTEVPDLETLEAIGSLALVRGVAVKDTCKPFISAHLLQLVELAVMTSSAATVFAQHQQAAEGASPAQPNATITLPLALPLSVDQRDVAAVLSDVNVLTKFLLGETRELPQHVLVAIWLDAYGSTAVIETPHPYLGHSEQRGVFRFPGAQSLLVTFDPRCATASDTAVLELSSYSSSSVSGSATSTISDDDAALAALPPLAFKRFNGAQHWPSGAVDFPGDVLAYRFYSDDENTRGVFGVSISVLAVGLARDKQLARTSAEQLETLRAKLLVSQSPAAESSSDATELTLTAATAAAVATTTTSAWSAAMDSQLVDWVNTNVENAASATLSSVDLRPSDVRLHATLDGLRCSLLLELARDAVQLRFALLKYLNQSLRECLPLLDLRDTSATWTIAHRLRLLSHCVFFDIKHALVEAAIDATSIVGDATNNSNNTARITLDRLQALESRDEREVEPSVSACFFAQAFRQLQRVDPAQFRRKIDSKGRLFSVKFRGEEGVDWGGVYREGATSMVDDLFSPHFRLFVLCPNGQHDTGANRGMYLPNPKCTSPVAIQMYEFVGKLLGISLRTRGDLPFAFPSLVWKQLLHDPLDASDLEATDAMFMQMLDGIRDCARDGITTAAAFAAAFDGLDLRFTAFDCTGHRVELVDGGHNMRVTFANRLAYCALATQCRLHEGALQIAAMRRGLATVFPLRALTLLTWHEMELLTCGSPKIDVAVWQQHTRYDGYSESDDAVQLFWQAMATFSDEQRSDFVRFAWGRSRLPRGKWPQPFKLTKKGGRDALRSLPVAHTCFFSVELPPYTTMATMRSMLLATINFGLGGILMA